VEYVKTGLLRFISHLDLVRLFTRAVRRAQLPVAYTRGFNPHPKLSLGPPLVVGAIGLHEYLDLELEKPIPPQKAEAQLGMQLPEGLKLQRIVALPPVALPLSKIIDCAWYRLPLPEADAPWQEIIEQLQQTGEWLYQRPKDGKTFDIKKGIKKARLFHQEGKPVLELLVRVGPGEVPLRGILEVLYRHGNCHQKPECHPVTRVGLFREQGDKLITPLGEIKNFGGVEAN
jgi:radical SAM-linked protein